MSLVREIPLYIFMVLDSWDVHKNLIYLKMKGLVIWFNCDSFFFLKYSLNLWRILLMIVRYHKIVFGVGRSLILSKETLPYELIKTHNCFILFYKNCNSHLTRFSDPDRSLNRKRKRFKVFEVEPRSNRGRTVMTS